MTRYKCMLYIIAIGFFLMAQPTWANQAYVTDSFSITLRTGPGLQNKIIAMLPSGMMVKVLDAKDKWSKVVVMEGKQKGMEGWVLIRYLVSRIPWELQAKGLQKENARFKKKLTINEKERSELSGRTKELSAKLDDTTIALKKIEADFELLKKESAEYLQLKTKYDKAQSELEVFRKTVQKLTSENDKLASFQRVTWFITGASVLFFGFVVGLLLGKKQKKQKSMFYLDKSSLY